MSFKISAPRKDRIASRFMAQVHAALSIAAEAAKKDDKVTQVKVARELGVDRSIISRILKGAGNPTIRTVGELSAALGYRPELVLKKITAIPGSNTYTVEPVRNAEHSENMARLEFTSTTNSTASASQIISNKSG